MESIEMSWLEISNHFGTTRYYGLQNMLIGSWDI